MLIIQTLTRKGFTLIELMVVISIISVLALIAVPNFAAVTTAANTAKIQADLRALDTAVITYYLAEGKYPTSMKALVSGTARYIDELPKPPTGKCYMGSSVPVDIPQTDGSPGYQLNASGDRAVLGGNLYSAFGR